MRSLIYLSPHLDDAVFSCGGLIAQQAAAGESVLIVTVCAGDPPPGELSPLAQELHRRWAGGVGIGAARRREDEAAAEVLRGAAGAGRVRVRHLAIPDAIYRRDRRGSSLYETEAALFGEVNPGDAVAAEPPEALAALRQEAGTIVCPLAVGGHVDHRWVRAAAERTGMALAYYFDLPYAARGGEIPPDPGRPPGIEARIALSSVSMEAWAAAVAAYASQFSTFWGSRAAWREETGAFLAARGGLPLLLPASQAPGGAPRPAKSSARS
jgi:LmbE family N-acetylglucosaminyl deacetylase